MKPYASPDDVEHLRSVLTRSNRLMHQYQWLACSDALTIAITAEHYIAGGVANGASRLKAQLAVGGERYVSQGAAISVVEVTGR